MNTETGQVERLIQQELDRYSAAQRQCGIAGIVLQLAKNMDNPKLATQHGVYARQIMAGLKEIKSNSVGRAYSEVAALLKEQTA